MTGLPDPDTFYWNQKYARQSRFLENCEFYDAHNPLHWVLVVFTVIPSTLPFFVFLLKGYNSTFFHMWVSLTCGAAGAATYLTHSLVPQQEVPTAVCAEHVTYTVGASGDLAIVTSLATYYLMYDAAQRYNPKLAAVCRRVVSFVVLVAMSAVAQLQFRLQELGQVVAGMGVGMVVGFVSYLLTVYWVIGAYQRREFWTETMVWLCCLDRTQFRVKGF